MSFLRGFIKGKKGLQKDIKKHTADLEKSIDKANAAADRFDKAFEKQFGKKLKISKLTPDDFIEKVR